MKTKVSIDKLYASVDLDLALDLDLDLDLDPNYPIIKPQCNNLGDQCLYSNTSQMRLMVGPVKKTETLRLNRSMVGSCSSS